MNNEENVKYVGDTPILVALRNSTIQSLYVNISWPWKETQHQTV